MSPVVNELATTRRSSRTSTSDRTVGSSDRDHVKDKAANLELTGADDEDKEAIKLQDSEDVVNGPPAGEQARPIIPWKYKLLAWTCIVFWGTGSWLGEQALGPLKATMKRELNITNAQYGAISSSSSFINSVLPIIGGIGMDHFGAGNAAVICSILMTVGLVVSACAANVGHHGLLIGGRILSGFGSGVLAQTGFKLYAHWFYGTNIALVYGIDIAWNRVITVVARASAVPMSRLNGWWGWALWIPAIIQGACMFLVIGYWFFERSVPVEFRPVTGRQRAQNWGSSTLQRAKGMLKSITTLPMLFWIIVVTQIPQNGAAVAFQGNMADMQKVTRGTTELAAGYNTSLQGIIPIVGTPLLGWFIDRYGFRMWFFSWTAILYVITFALMGLTTVHPLAPILISSVAFVSNILPFMASVPVLIGDDAKLGSALGVFNSIKNANILVLDVLSGVVQDNTPGKTYERVIYMLIAIKAIDIFVGPIYDYLDGRWLGHSLRKPEKERVAFRAEVLEQKRDLRGWRVERPVFISVACIMTAWVIIGWVLFILYSI